MSDRKHPHQDDLDTFYKLQRTLAECAVLIDTLNKNNVKLRLRVGQGKIQHDKVFWDGTEQGTATLIIVEAIKHVPLYKPSILKSKEDDTV